VKNNLITHLILFTTGLLCGLWLNWKEPKVIQILTEKPPETTIFQFHNSRSVYLTVDGNAFRLSVDGKWDGLTFVKEK
jgi:hypothetical protein